MRKKLLPMFLLMLMGMVGNLTVLAQTPEPSGQWNFDSPSDLMAATTGNVTLSPAVIGAASVSTATVDEAGITVAEGPKGTNAIFVPAASALKVERAEGAEASTNFSFMIDLKVPNAYVYDGLFQTSPTNSNDGEVFISKSQIGAGAMGGYYGCIWDDFWYRVVFTNSNGSVKLYVNGKKIIDYETTNTRWEIDPVFYLLCDEDGEKSDTYVSQVAFWETPLTDEQVAELGSLNYYPWITDVNQIKEGDQFYIISDRAKFNGSSTAKPKAMASLQSHFSVNWGEQYVYWGDLVMESDGFVWTAEKVGDQWAFLNKENGKYLGNMNEGENDVIFSDEPVGYTLSDLKEGAGRFYMTNDESEHSLHVQGYLRNDRGNNSLAKQEVGDDDYANAYSSQCGYPGRWRLLNLKAEEPVDTRTKIATAEDLVAFAQAVEAGEANLEAVLTADIDLTGYDSPVLIGNKGNNMPFSGTFDGDGHTITYNYTTVGDYSGLFGYVSGANIRNLRVEGSAKVQGVHFGALMGYVEGTVLVENVVTDVDITGDRSGVTGDGGMIGRLEGPVTFNNCATLGTMGNVGTSMYCGFVAYAGNGSSALNNCFTASKLTEGTSTDYCFTFCRGTAIYNNCYYVNAIGTKDGGTQITEDMLASGELCYMLNGDQSTIGWYQTLGEDALPVPSASHAQVYANGELKCDGTSVGGELVYSNSATSSIPPHNYDDGWCSVCGAWQTNYLTADNEGYYNIGSANDFAWIAKYIEQGNPNINIKLKADIDLTTSKFPNVMLGNGSNQYAGTFDGAEHKVTYNYTISSNYCGLFAYVNGATIRNLRVEGAAVSTAIHFGALIGQANGIVLVENVVTDVDITGKSTTGVQGDAGMLGANYANITFNNCATLGEMGYEGSSMYSSFSGWSHGESSTTLNNCYTTCKLTAGTGTGNCFTLTHGSGTISLNNCYYLNEVGAVQGTHITTNMASGEFCYKLNGDQSVISWYQTIGTDALPVPFASHATVYANGTLRCDGAELPGSPVVYSNTEGQTTKAAHQYGADGICTVCGSPKQNADGFYLIDTAQKLNWFATKTSEGTANLDALLTADIDLTTSDYPDLMIGTEENEYAGIFDGAGHTITYNYALVADKWRGLFAFVNGATICNLYVEGNAVVTNIHFGALIGRAYGTVLVENVITNVNITGQRGGVTGDGGMLGANYANITFNNCATLGEMGYEGSSMYSSFSAWSNGSSSTTLNNCYSLCKLTDGTGTGNCFTLTHQSGTITINNSYYLNVIGKVIEGASIDQAQITEEEVANGSLAAKLAGGWYQNVGEDAYPVLDKTHATMKEITEAGYATMYIPAAVEVPEGVEVFTGSFKTEDDETTLNLNPVTDVVPGWEPVVLKGAPGIYGFMPAPATEKSTVVVFSDWNVENATDLPTTQVEGLTFSFDSGVNTQYAPKYYSNGASARIYAGNTMTISAVAPITKIVFTFVNNYAFQSGGFELSDGEYTLTTKTWTGSAESITFTNTSTKQWRIVSMTVTYAGYPGNVEGNVLKGAAENIEAAGKYVLAKPEGEQVGFYLADGGTIKAGKAYLESESGVKAFYFTGEDATSIADIEKTVENGAIYNLAGQRVGKMQKGINIVNGKKILK